MPYIKNREFYDEVLNRIDFSEVVAGDLAYLVTKLMIKFTEVDISYKQYALVTGILETVKAEFYRRQIVEYENEAIERNGDVYGK